MNIKLLAGFVVSLAVVGTAGDSLGQYGCTVPYVFWGYNYPQGGYLTESPPYFALHPPVYYSAVVPRSYGYSPFPYPPYILTPGSETPGPKVVQNLYSGGNEESSPDVRQPLRIDNPYVEQPGRAGVTKSTGSPSRRPQRVYPAALLANHAIGATGR